jgi:hypothetical protein
VVLLVPVTRAALNHLDAGPRFGRLHLITYLCNSLGLLTLATPHPALLTVSPQGPVEGLAVTLRA